MRPRPDALHMTDSRELFVTPMMPSRRRSLVLLAALGMFAYLALALMVDAPRIVQALGAVGAGGVVTILALSLLNYLLRYVRWAGYLKALGHTVPALRHLAYYLGGFAFTVSPGKAGEAVRSVYLHPHGVPYAHSLAGLFVERLLDALAVTALSLLVVFSAGVHLPGIIACAVLFGAVALFAAHDLAPRLLRRLSARLGARAQAALLHLASLLESSARLLRPQLLLPGLLIGLIAWGAEGYGLYLLARELQLPLGVVSGIGIYSLAVLAGAAAFFMPGGLGGMEVAMTALLVAAGVPLALAFVMTVLCRLATLWFAVVLGILALLWIEATPQASPA